MISSTSCSSRLLAALLPAGLALALPAATAALEAGNSRPPSRVALLPIDNASGAAAPIRELRDAMEVALARTGVELVSADGLERFLSAHRIRYTGGIDQEDARAAGEELGVDGVLITTLEQYSEDRPALALSMRLVAATEQANLLWFDGVGRAGDDSPGLLALGVITSMKELQERVLTRLARSLAAAMEGKGPRAPACPDGRRFTPRTPYRSPLLERGKTYSVAVVPFRNLTRRRNAGEILAMEFARQLTGVDSFKVLEPGVVRQQLLRSRIVMEGGISLDQVRTILSTLDADLVLAGDVLEYDDTVVVPAVNFTATVLDTKSGRILWQSTSYNRGDDRVYFFGLGTISTASALACRMVRSDIEGMFTTKTVRPSEPKEQPKPFGPAR
jgi:TolB-like protein